MCNFAGLQSGLILHPLIHTFNSEGKNTTSWENPEGARVWIKVCNAYYELIDRKMQASTRDIHPMGAKQIQKRQSNFFPCLLHLLVHNRLSYF